MNRPKVILWNGKLMVRTGMRLLIIPLSKCLWREGKAAFDTTANILMLSGDALIIEFKVEKYDSVTRVAVGFTPESNEVWRQLFTLAEIPQESPMDSLWKIY